MKHIFNNLSEEDIKQILEQHIGGKEKRICVKIPEAFVDDYKMMLREFKNKHMLKSLPFGVYDV